MNFWTYSPSDVQILIAGVHSVTGIPEGTFVEVSKDVQPMTTQRSTDGLVVRKHTTDNSFTIRLTVYRASPTNDLLTKIWQADEITQMAKFPLLIKDTSGSGFFFSTTTWVEQLPDMSYSSNMENYTWVLRSSQGIINIGSNDKPGVLQELNNLAFSGIPLINEVLGNV